MVVAMNQPREDLGRLASYVVAARIKAGFATRKDFAAATGITARTLGKLENGSERVSADTLARVAEVLRWTPDSPAHVMSGREPIAAYPPAALRPVAPSPPPPPGSPAEEILADLLERYPDDQVVVALGAQHHKAPRIVVAEILEWLDFLSEGPGPAASSSNAGLREDGHGK